MPVERAAAGSGAGPGVAAVALLACASGVLLWLLGERVDAARAAAERERWRDVVLAVSRARPDTDPLALAREIVNPGLLDTSAPATVWPLLRDGGRVGSVVRVPVPDGYNGRLEVVVGIDTAGRVSGVAVPRHAETPAYGGRLANDAAFLATFRGLDGATPEARWIVAPGDGSLDGTTGATVTMTAITNGVRRALGVYRLAESGP